MECSKSSSIHSLIFHSNSDISRYLIMSSQAGIHVDSPTGTDLGVSMMLKYSGTTYHLRHIRLSHDFCHINVYMLKINLIYSH